MSTESHHEQLARLELKVQQRLAECAELEHHHPVAARRLKEAICDLQILIAYLRCEPLPDALSDDSSAISSLISFLSDPDRNSRFLTRA